METEGFLAGDGIGVQREGKKGRMETEGFLAGEGIRAQGEGREGLSGE
jgi:hypothetical protein